MKILVIQTGFIGDVILSTPVFTKVKQEYPKAELDLLTTKTASSLFKNDPRFADVLVYDKRAGDKGFSGFVRMRNLIRSKNYDLIISLHKSIRTSLLVFLSGAKQTLGFKEAALSFLYSRTAKRKDLQHEVLRNLAIFRAINIDPEKIALPLSLSYSGNVREKIDSFLSRYQSELVGIAPGSVWATKRWRVEGFAEIAKILSDKGYQVLLIGGPEDRKISDDIIGNTQRAENLCGEFSLAESAYLISKLRFIITNDSSPLHMASAASTPVIALFCATIPEFGFGPWKVKNKILGVENLKCRPCGPHGGNICPTGTHYCQSKLEASMVSKAIVELEKELTNANLN